MENFTKLEVEVIKDAMSFPNGRGYVLDFSDKTFAYFLTDEFEIDIYDDKYACNGTSKVNRLITYIQSIEKNIVLKLLRKLWERREGLLSVSKDSQSNTEAKKFTERYSNLITTFEGSFEVVNSEGVDKFSDDITLEELVNDINRTLEARKPEVALDRLHTYCFKKIKHILEYRDIEYNSSENLDALFGKYRNKLVREQKLTKFSDKAMKSSVALLNEFNYLRNNKSLSHDNEILDNVEAHYIFSTVNATLVLIRSLEINRYED